MTTMTTAEALYNRSKPQSIATNATEDAKLSSCYEAGFSPSECDR